MSARKSEAAENTADREIIITRVLDAPRELVWEAWTDPKHVAQWWGPHGFTTTIEKMDVRPGGVWKHVMHGPDGSDYPNSSVFTEVVKPERIVFTLGGGKKGEPGVSFLATWTFEAQGNKTKVTMHSVFPSAAERNRVVKEYGAIEGGKQTLSRLAAHLAGDFLISRLVDAPRDKVWKCWAEPERLAAWFGPKDFETVAAKLDFKPGGVYHYCMRGNGIEMWGKWTFVEIDAPAKLAFMSAFSDKDGGLGRHPLAPTWPAQMSTTVLFADFGPKTLITIQWSPYQANEEERKTFSDGMAGMTQGWSGTFERLDDYLKENV